MTEGPIRVTILAENMFGGTGVHTASLADALAAHGDSVRLILGLDTAVNRTGALILPQHPQVTVHHAVARPGQSRAAGMAAALRAAPADVVFIPKGSPTEGGLLTDLRAKRVAPLVVFEHDAPPLELPTMRWNGWRPSVGLYRRMPLWINGWRHHLAARVLTNSHSTRQKQHDFYGGQVDEVVPLGVDLTRFRYAPVQHRTPHDGLRLGIVGRPDIKMKGLDLAFSAIRELAASVPGPLVVEFPVADAHQDSMSALAERSGVSGTLRIVPSVPEEALPAFYASLDALLVASRFEGGPYTMLEAMACGTPVIATPVGLVPDVIEDGVNGIRVATTDSVPALVTAIERFRALAPEERGVMGERARAVIVARHDAKQHFARLRAILHEVARR